MDLSAVIVNWNTRDLLRRCLASLRSVARALRQEGRELEVIVVDNASGDGSAAMVAGEFPEVRLVANRENRNYAAASNQALKVSEGEYVLLLNPDTELPEGSAGELLRFLEAHPAAGAVAPRLVHQDGRTQLSVRGFPTPAALFGDLSGLGRWFPESRWGGYRQRRLPEETPVEVEQPMASCFLLRRRALQGVGGFDEQFPLFFNDVDLCYRLRQAGWAIWYDPRVRVLHEGGASTRQVRPAAVLQSHRGLLRFYRKHYRAQMHGLAYGAAVIAIVAAGAIRWVLAGPRSLILNRNP